MDESNRLATLRRYAIMDTPAEADFDAIAQEAARAMQVRSAVVSFIDDDRQWYKARTGIAATMVPRALSFCRHAIQADEVMVVPDARTDPRFAASPFVIGDPFVRFYAAAPIKALNRARLGTLCIFDPEPRDGLSPRERRMLSALAARVVELLEQRRWQAFGRPSQPSLLARSS